MSDPFVGQIRLFGFNFAPVGYALCNGQILPISQHTALFSLLGTQFGGNGTSTFALPNLQSRVAIHQHQGPGLSDYVIGEEFGVENVTLLTSEMPAHTHSITHTLTATPACKAAAGDQQSPVGHVPAIEAAGVTAVYSDGVAETTMSGSSPCAGSALAQANGGNLPHENRQPVLALNFCIAMAGVFPARN